MALQERRHVAVRQRLHAREDRLQAAAQAVAGSLQRRHRCLIALPDAAWLVQPPQARGCAREEDVQALKTGPLVAGIVPYTLLQYCPQASAPPEPPGQISGQQPDPPAPGPMLEAQLLLEIEEEGDTYRSASRLLWSWGPDALPRLRGFQHLGLRSAAAPLPVCPLVASGGNS